MEEFLNNSGLFKIRLVKSERDIFGDPISSNEWDKIENLLYKDVKQKVFNFVHPKRSGIVYERRYKICPVSGIAWLEVGKQGDFTNNATVRVISKSYMYKIPYLVIEDYYPTVKNVDLMAKIVQRAFNNGLKEYGLEVILEPLESEEPILWLLDFEISYKKELKKRPEIAKTCKGHQEAVEYAAKIKELEEKEPVKTKRSNKSDDIRIYIKKGKKEFIVNWLHRVLMGLSSQKEISMPFRLLFDLEVTCHIPYNPHSGTCPGIRP